MREVVTIFKDVKRKKGVFTVFKHKKRWIVSLVLMITLVGLAACGEDEQESKEVSSQGENAETEATAWDALKEKGTFTVATSGTLFPSSFHDGENNELTGYEVEVVKEIGKRLELPIEFVEMGVDGMLTAVKSGQVDAAANGLDITEKRLEDYNFSEPYKYSFGGIVVRASDDSVVESLEDLKGKKSAGGATTIYMQISEKFGAEPVVYDNATNDVFFRDVASGRTDVILNDFYISNTAVNKFKELGVKMSDIYYNPTSAGILLKKEDDSIKNKIDEVLEELHEDGTLTKLSEEFFAGEDVSKPIEGIDDLPVVELDQ